MNRPLSALRPVVATALAFAGLACLAPARQIGLSSFTDGPWVGRLAEPVTMPYWFESPTIHTSLRPVYVHHRFPGDSILGKGSLDVYALQARIAINERLAIIATKDGYMDLDLDSGVQETGWADIAGGFKYALLDDSDTGRLVSVGLVGEFSQGSSRVIQGNGDGILRPFVASGFDMGAYDLLATVGYNHPLDSDAESTSLDWHFNLSFEATESVRPFVELNGISYLEDGKALGVSQEGVDVANLGSTDVSGNDVVTGALGLRWSLSENVQFGAAWEAPVFTSRSDLYDDRITLDVILYL
jgi:hypothetical protein